MISVRVDPFLLGITCLVWQISHLYGGGGVYIIDATL